MNYIKRIWTTDIHKLGKLDRFIGILMYGIPFYFVIGLNVIAWNIEGFGTLGLCLGASLIGYFYRGFYEVIDYAITGRNYAITERK